MHKPFNVRVKLLASRCVILALNRLRFCNDDLFLPSHTMYIPYTVNYSIINGSAWLLIVYEYVSKKFSR